METQVGKKSIIRIIGLILSIIICFLPALIGARFGPDEWYFQLRKPSWTPPGYLFGPVWTFLYATMGVSAWLVWRQHGFREARLALSLFVAQLALNGAWTWIFFGLRAPGAAFFEIVALWLLILATLIAFWRKQKVAGILLLPYLIWVGFASVLTYTIWQLNRAAG